MQTTKTTRALLPISFALPLLLLLVEVTSFVDGFVIVPASARSEAVTSAPSSSWYSPPPPLPTITTTNPTTSTKTTRTSTALKFMGALSDDILLTHRPIQDISHALQTWFPRDVVLPQWMPSGLVVKYGMMITYVCLGMALIRLGLLGTPSLSATIPLLWMIHLLGTTTSAQLLGFGMQRLRSAFIIQLFLLSSMPIILWKLVSYDLAAFCFLLPYLGWLTFVVVLLHQLCRLNPTT